jgi:hypothetical protein
LHATSNKARAGGVIVAVSTLGADESDLLPPSNVTRSYFGQNWAAFGGVFSLIDAPIIVTTSTFVENIAGVLGAVYMVDYSEPISLSDIKRKRYTPMALDDNVYHDNLVVADGPHGYYGHDGMMVTVPSYIIMTSNTTTTKYHTSNHVITPPVTFIYADWFGNHIPPSATILNLKQATIVSYNGSATPGGIVTCTSSGLDQDIPNNQCIFPDLTVTGQPGSSSYFGASATWKYDWLPKGERVITTTFEILLRGCHDGEEQAEKACEKCVPVSHNRPLTMVCSKLQWNDTFQ